MSVCAHMCHQSLRHCSPFLRGEVLAPRAGSRVGRGDPTGARGWLGTGGPCPPGGRAEGDGGGGVACLLGTEPAVWGCWEQGPAPRLWPLWLPAAQAALLSPRTEGPVLSPPVGSWAPQWHLAAAVGAPPWVGTKVTLQKVRLVAVGKNREIPFSAHMQMRVGAGDPVPKPPATALPSPSLGRAGGVSVLPPPRPPSQQTSPPETCPPPGGVLLAGHGCVPTPGRAVPVPCQPDPPDGAARCSHLQAGPRQDPRGQGRPSEPVTSSLLWPRKSGRLCPGSWAVGACGQRQVCALPCRIGPRAHCRVLGTVVLGLCWCCVARPGLTTGWAGPLLRPQGCTRSVLHALKVSTEQPQERAEHRNLLSLCLTSPIFQGCGTARDAWRMMDDAGGENLPPKLGIPQRRDWTPRTLGCPRYSHGTQPQVGELGFISFGAALPQRPQHQQGQPGAQRRKWDSWGRRHHPSQAPSPAACGSEVSATAVAAGQQEAEVVLSPATEKTPGSLSSFLCSPCDSVTRGELLSADPHGRQPAARKGPEPLGAAIRQEPAACKMFSPRFRSVAPAPHRSSGPESPGDTAISCWYLPGVAAPRVT